MGEKHSVKAGEAVRECVRVCLFAQAPSAVQARLMQTLRENGEFSSQEAVWIERTVARVLRKALPLEIDRLARRWQCRVPADEGRTGRF